MYFHDVDEYFETANESLLISPIIESQEAIDKIDDIMSVDGIDAAWSMARPASTVTLSRVGK